MQSIESRAGGRRLEKRPSLEVGGHSDPCRTVTECEPAHERRTGGCVPGAAPWDSSILHSGGNDTVGPSSTSRPAQWPGRRGATPLSAESAWDPRTAYRRLPI